MIEIQATEAAKRFGHLIEQVMAGEDVRIIRQGRHVANVTRKTEDLGPSDIRPMLVLIKGKIERGDLDGASVQLLGFLSDQYKTIQFPEKVSSCGACGNALPPNGPCPTCEEQN